MDGRQSLQNNQYLYLNGLILTNSRWIAKPDNYLRVVPVTFLCVILSSPKRVFAVVESRSYDIASKTVAPRWHQSTQYVPFSYRSNVYDELMPQYIDVPPRQQLLYVEAS